MVEPVIHDIILSYSYVSESKGGALGRSLERSVVSVNNLYRTPFGHSVSDLVVFAAPAIN